jgi:hypothetical protein
MPPVALTATVGLLTGAVAVIVAVATGVAVPVAVTVGVFILVPVVVIVGVSVTIGDGVGFAPGEDVTVGVNVAVWVFPGVGVTVGVIAGCIVTVGVTGTVGVAAGSVGEGVGSIVAPGGGVLRNGLDTGVLEGTSLRPLLLVASTRAVFPRAPVGLARQGLGGRVGVTTIKVGVTAGGAVAVITTALLTGL